MRAASAAHPGGQGILASRRGATAGRLAYRQSLGPSLRWLPPQCRPAPAEPVAPPRQSTAGNGLALQDSPAVGSEPDPQAEGGKKMDWGKLWYAVALEADVDSTRPYPVTLLGRELVVWKDGAGAWRCFEDRCPHRNAPLSEGKVWEDGTLICAYHGWRFQGSGQCVAIPQAASAEAQAAACASPKACARTYPIQAAHGVLFVWGEGGGAAAEHAQRTPLPLDDLRSAAEASGQRLHFFIAPWMRDAPYDCITTVEQAVDPAHVDWAHHQLQGDRRLTKFGDWDTWAGTADGPAATDGSGPGANGDGAVHAGVVASMGWNDGKTGQPSTLALVTPAFQRVTQLKPDGSAATVAVYMTPVRPGWLRSIAIGLASGPSVHAGMKFLGALPLWVQHAFFMNPTADGDLVLLHPAEQRLIRAARAGDPAAAAWRRAYYLPTAAGRMVVAFRKWLEGPGGHGPWGTPLADLPDYPSEMDRRQLLDRYTTHTQHCPSCSKANTRMVALGTAAAAAATAAWAAALWVAATAGGAAAGAAAAALRGRHVLVLAAVGVALWLARVGLERLRQAAFYWSDYKHAERLH